MLEQIESRLSALIESTADFIWSVDLNFRLLTFNRVLQQDLLTNFGTQAAVGMRPQDLLPPEIAELWPPLYRRALAEGPFRVEWPFVSGRIMELALNPIVVNGNPIGVSVFGTDITERKASENARLEAEKRYRDIFDRTLDGMFQTTPEGTALIINPAMARMLGYDSPQDAIATVKNTSLQVWVDPAERSRCAQLLEEHGTVMGFECQFKCQDESIIWVSLNCRKVYAPDGLTFSYEGFIQDITERKAAERAQLAAEKRFQGIFNRTRDGMYQTTPEGVCLVTNPAMASMMGYDSPEELTVAVTDSANQVWVDPADRAMYRQLLEENGTILGFESRFKRKDGTILWVSLNTRKVSAPDGKTRYYEGFVQDITDRKRTESQLQDSEERYRASFDQAAVGIIHVSFEGQILRCNARFAEILGYPMDEIPGKTFQQLTPPEYLPESMEALKQLLSGASSATGLEKPYLRKDGTLAWVRLTSSLQRDGNGQALHLVAFMEDINARKAAEEHLVSATKALQTNEARYRSVFQTSLDALSITNLSDGTLTEVNQAFLDLMGYTRDEVIGRTSIELGFWENLQDRDNVVAKLRQDSSFRDERTRLKKKNREIFWVHLSASVIEIEGTACMFCVTRDLSDARAAQDEIRNLAFYDSLTHLPNRRLLLDRMLQALSGDTRSTRKRALLFVDLDDFKSLNDTLGHSMGDLLLQDVARRLTDCVHEADTVARYGADEFVVMLEDLSLNSEEAADEAEIVGEKMLAALAQPFLLAGRETQGTASIGITVFGDKRESTSEVLQQADMAMHQAKTAGGNTVRFFAPALQAAVNARAAMKEDLSQAIAANQFLLYYQPQVDATGLIGVEALMRWKHPERGLVPPNDFIPLAEETGLILPLGTWALETACRQIAEWANRKESAHIQIAVNISARQFCCPDFVEHILATLHQTGANPKNLKLELTESMLANDIEEVIAKMTLLKSHGLTFSLDDFGTGYSSLSYLKRLPLDQLKIDRAFVQDILADVASASIAQTIISLGRAMDLSVIAEGVETEAQRKFLHSLGAHSFQGYLFSRPLPLEELERIWLSHAPALQPSRRNPQSVTHPAAPSPHRSAASRP